MSYRTFGLVIWMGTIAGVSLAQNSKKDVRSLTGEARYFFDNELYIQALPYYLEAEKKNPGDKEVNLNIGICYLNSNDLKKKALPFLDFAAKQGDISPDVYYYLGRAMHINYEFDQAITSFNTFIEKVPEKGNEEFVKDAKRQIEMCENAKEFIDKPVNAIIENLGPEINSPYADYVPVISADESVLIFTSRRPGSTGNKKFIFDKKYYEDIYMSTKIDTVWGPPVNIGSPINTDKHDATVGLSADGQQLYVYRLGDIYYCNLIGDQWSEPTKFASDVNTRMWEPSASISADGNVFYFSSDRKGGHGKRDIWRVKKLPDGEWSFAQNLGPEINTEYDEDGPFIHPSGKTIYFSSNGHKSMGGFDIFSSELTETGKWEEPVNIGYPVNTPDDDIYFVLSAEGKHGYFSSVREDSYGEKDIYMITFPEISIPLTVMRGFIYGADKIPVGAKIVVTDNETGELVGIFKSNSATGKYIIILPPGRDYNFTVEGEGENDYLFYSKNVNIPDQSEFKVIEDSILIKEIKVGAKTVLRNLFFDTDKSDLRPTSRVELDRIFRLLRDNQQIKVEISGHTDGVGSKKYNKRLSEKRANAVVEYLYERGVQKNRLTAKGYGKLQPIADNSTEDGRQQNRRTELKIIEINEEGDFKSDTSVSHVIYKIQIAYGKQLLPADHKSFKGVQGVVADQSDKTLIRYVTGNYSDYGAASDFRDEIKSKNGILDCFIVAYQGEKRITIREAKRLTTKY
ncbi:MAG: OmpA family protein [Bacteroidia bacterium]|nr:OmpA family protein [Bacteroidia bacterium]